MLLSGLSPVEFVRFMMASQTVQPAAGPLLAEPGRENMPLKPHQYWLATPGALALEPVCMTSAPVVGQREGSSSGRGASAVAISAGLKLNWLPVTVTFAAFHWQPSQ